MPLFALLATSVSLAQNVAPQDASAAVDPQILARYDRNRDGRLDASELAVKVDDEARQASAATADETIVLSPFTVQSDETGYYASNAMSGTRMNSKIEDIAASVSVVTKQQLLDTAAIDINDIFLYEANTEGTLQYTEFSVDRNGNVSDSVMDNAASANRIRGTVAANTARGSFATNNRIPIDTYNIDSVEIARGSNSSLFGLGSGAGTININTSRANPTRSTSQFTFRIDDWGGYRASVDFNRPLIRNNLAIRLSAVYDDKGFTRKPAHDLIRRLQLAVTAKPFPSTTVRAAYESYQQHRRPVNAQTPRDFVSDWLNGGQPTWNPTTQRIRKNGVLSAPIPWSGTSATAPNAAISTFLRGGSTDVSTVPLDVLQNGPSENELYTRAAMLVDNGQLALWTVNRTSSGSNPNNPNTNVRILQTTQAIFKNRSLFPLFVPYSISDSSIYDYESLNITGANWTKQKADIYSVEVEQTFLETTMLKLYGQGGWFLEDYDEYNRNNINASSILYIDINETLLDGNANPYFLRPYIGTVDANSMRRPEYNDNIRAAVAGELDFSKRDGWQRWLGTHRATAYFENRKITTGTLRFREAVFDNHIWVNSSNRANGAALGRVNYRYYLGDNQGFNVENAPPLGGSFGMGMQELYYRNGVTGQWVREAALRGETGQSPSNQARREITTRGFAVQNFLWNGRIVTTLGVRDDETRARNSSGAAVNAASNGFLDYTPLDNWGNWATREGKTKTKGVVFKPFRDASWAPASLKGINFHYNISDSFRPDPPAFDLFANPIPNPTGESKDYGFSVNLFNGNLVARVNWYDDQQINARAGGEGQTMGDRITRMEDGGDAFNLHDWLIEDLTAFYAAQGVVKTPVELGDEAWARAGLSQAWRNQTPKNTTGDIQAKGVEVELTYNPTRSWTMKFTGKKSETLDTQVFGTMNDFLATRLPVWTSIRSLVIPTGQTQGSLWWEETDAENFYVANILTPIAQLAANNGKPRTQVAKYGWSFTSTYRFSEGRLRNVGIGGSLRWTDKRSIGFFGLPAENTGLAAPVVLGLDRSKPYWTPAEYAGDVWASYDFRLFGDKVRTRVQLNVRNVLESGGLKVIRVNPDGTPSNFRIVDPRQFVLTTSFDL